MSVKRPTVIPCSVSIEAVSECRTRHAPMPTPGTPARYKSSAYHAIPSSKDRDEIQGFKEKDLPPPLAGM